MNIKKSVISLVGILVFASNSLAAEPPRIEINGTLAKHLLGGAILGKIKEDHLNMTLEENIFYDSSFFFGKEVYDTFYGRGFDPLDIASGIIGTYIGSKFTKIKIKNLIIIPYIGTHKYYIEGERPRPLYQVTYNLRINFGEK